MNQNQYIQNLRKISNRVEKIELTHKLFNSDETDILALLLEIILHPDDYDTTLDYEMFIEVIKKNEKERELIINKIIDKIEESVLSEEGIACAYALGEIIRLQLTAFNQTPNPDIPKILVKAGEDNITQAATQQLNSLTFALFQYANEGPLPEAESFLRQVLELCKKENDEELDTFTLDYILELLYLNNGEAFLMEMKELFQNLRKDTELSNYVEMFIIEKEERLLEI
jgi:hypothetical protein